MNNTESEMVTFLGITFTEDRALMSCMTQSAQHAIARRPEISKRRRNFERFLVVVGMFPSISGYFQRFTPRQSALSRGAAYIQ